MKIALKQTITVTRCDFCTQNAKHAKNQSAINCRRSWPIAMAAISSANTVAAISYFCYNTSVTAKRKFIINRLR